MMKNLNEKLEKYIDENNYYEDQKKKADLDKYFSDLKSANLKFMVFIGQEHRLKLDTQSKWLK